MKTRKAFGLALRKVRVARGLTQEDFGIISSRTYVSSLERGQKSPTIDKLDDLAAVLQVHPVALLAIAHASSQSQAAAVLLLRRLAVDLESLTGLTPSESDDDILAQ
ncbi:helix-turn-helix transcriptional regulator [Nevskia sp.]|uniref:helix-turn-helix domain-containing protein n=1 Tax=Nevskia sp. TaxID=1929292 RepID=UPI0025EB9DE4|nr:helix-turn-helix transcriptional regulator [Nevskia sp.]